MTFHAPNCASLRLLLSHPPQTQPCDCALSAGHFHVEPERDDAALALMLDRHLTLSPQRSGEPAPAPAQPAVGEVPDTSRDAAPNVIPLLRPVPKSGGSPSATPTATTMAECLRVLADKMERGELASPESLIVFGCDTGITHLPYLVGGDMSAAQMLGKIEIGKAMLLDQVMSYV